MAKIPDDLLAGGSGLNPSQTAGGPDLKKILNDITDDLSTLQGSTVDALTGVLASPVPALTGTAATDLAMLRDQIVALRTLVFQIAEIQRTRADATLKAEASDDY